MTKPIDPDKLEGMLLQYLPKEKIAPASDDVEEGDEVIPDFIRHIDAIDVETGLKHCGSGKAYIATLKIYIENASKNADEIENFWSALDIKNTTIKVHALKSSSRIIGALELGDFAERLEKAGDAGDTKMLDEDLPKLISQYRNLVEKLKMLNEQDVPEVEDNRPIITAKELSEAYGKLAKYCANFDFDNVVLAAQTLEEYQIPEGEADRVAAILKAVDNFDYEKISGIITKEV